MRFFTGKYSGVVFLGGIFAGTVTAALLMAIDTEGRPFWAGMFVGLCLALAYVLWEEIQEARRQSD